YAAAERLSPVDLHAVSKFCFLEMARAGITAVGEFHYLHRDPQGKPYADGNELSLAVARAAREVGLRIVLLRAAYARSGYRLAPNPRQRRFIEGSAEEYLKNLDALSKQVQVGAAPHSVRACPLEWIRDIAAEAKRRGWVLHMHVSEQPREVDECKAEHGTTPPLLLERLGALQNAVHAAHLSADDVPAPHGSRPSRRLLSSPIAPDPPTPAPTTRISCRTPSSRWSGPPAARCASRASRSSSSRGPRWKRSARRCGGCADDRDPPRAG